MRHIIFGYFPTEDAADQFSEWLLTQHIRQKGVTMIPNSLWQKSRIGTNRPTGAKALFYFQLLAARLKSCPDTKLTLTTGS
jgi:hypothetical protein